jgi:hypothetical protein
LTGSVQGVRQLAPLEERRASAPGGFDSSEMVPRLDPLGPGIAEHAETATPHNTQAKALRIENPPIIHSRGLTQNTKESPHRANGLYDGVDKKCVQAGIDKVADQLK